jgi:hypothetical protein
MGAFYKWLLIIIIIIIIKVATAWRHWNLREYIHMAFAIDVAKEIYLYKQNNYYRIL